MRYDAVATVFIIIIIFFFFINLYIHIHNATIYISFYCNVSWPADSASAHLYLYSIYSIYMGFFLSTSIYTYIYIYINEAYTYFVYFTKKKRQMR